MRSVAAALALIFLTSCEGETRVPDRLVPGDVYFSAHTLQETIQIHQGFGGEGYGLHRLTYELRPDNELRVGYWLMTQSEVVAEDNFDLSSDAADMMRRNLWRLRPENISDDLFEEWPTLPLDCERRGTHDFGDIWIAFLPHENEARGRMFELPIKASCNSASAKQARLLIQEVLASLPSSKIADEFHKAKVGDDGHNYLESKMTIQSLTN